MNYESLVASMAAADAKVSAQDREQILSRAATSAVPLAIGDVISFAADAKEQMINIGGNVIPMIAAVYGDKFDPKAEGLRVSLSAFARKFYNPQTKVLSTPVDICPKEADVTKLTYTLFKDGQLLDIPSKLQGKSVKILAIEEYENVDLKGRAMLQPNGRPMTTVIYAMELV